MSKLFPHIVVFITSVLITVGILFALEIPTVYESFSKKKCVHVDDPRYNCENLPKKYNHVWVK